MNSSQVEEEAASDSKLNRSVLNVGAEYTKFITTRRSTKRSARQFIFES